MVVIVNHCCSCSNKAEKVRGKREESLLDVGIRDVTIVAECSVLDPLKVREEKVEKEPKRCVRPH